MECEKKFDGIFYSVGSTTWLDLLPFPYPQQSLEVEGHVALSLLVVIEEGK